jgi:hypothetical protein
MANSDTSNNTEDINKAEKNLELTNNSIIINYILLISIILNLESLNNDKQTLISELNGIKTNDSSADSKSISDLINNLVLFASLLAVGNNIEKLKSILTYSSSGINLEELSSAQKDILVSLLQLITLLI